MTDVFLQYRACGAECREYYLRSVVNENGLPLDCGSIMTAAVNAMAGFGGREPEDERSSGTRNC